MFHARVGLLPIFSLSFLPWVSALAQSVVSTHSGLVYFFEGSVSVGGQRLEQKFGRFPDIGEGGELRTESGRAEVLLTPGVFLRIGDNSSIRLISNKLSDTQVELLQGSAILEATEDPGGRDVTILHKSWRIRLPHDGVYRLDSDPPRVTAYKGEVEVSSGGTGDGTTIHSGQMLPLAEVLAPEETPAAPSDSFKNWAMSRSQAIASDNATAASITDDPDAMTTAGDPLDSLSYFPLTGIPGIAITNPYGLSFWSPFQSTLNAVYFPPYSYGALYPSGWPSVTRRPLVGISGGMLRFPTSGTSLSGIGLSRPAIGSGLHLGTIPAPRPTMRPMTLPARPAAPPHAGAHPIGHR